MQDLKVVEVIMDKEYLFQGLNLEAINYLRNNGMWMPVAKDLIEVNPELMDSPGQVYAHYESSELMYFVIEKGEYLTGRVYDVIDNDKPLTSSNFIHQYALETGKVVRENIQHIVEGVMFLELVDEDENVVCCWNNLDIEYIIANIRK